MLSQDLQFSSVPGSGVSSAEGDSARENPRSDSWKQLVAQVESSLCREERSRQALDQLQQLATEQGASTQFLLKSVIRETIRITMECLSDVKERLSPAARIEKRAIEKRVLPQPQVLTADEKQAKEDADMVEALNHALKNVPTRSLFDRLRPPLALQVAPEVLLHQAVEAREVSLRSLCDRIHTARLNLGLDLRKVHSETFIAIHYLQALDEGKIDRLPEDVYLRGFLRRLEKCLHLPEGDLTSRLPQSVDNPSLPISHTAQGRSQSFTGVIPQARVSLPFQLNYAYLTYAALMAGGVFWVSHQGAPKNNFTPIEIDLPSPSAPVKVNKPQRMSSESVQKVQVRVSHNFSMPEAFI